MTRNRRQQRPTPPAPTPLITVAEARNLALGLVGDLTPHAGDPDAVRKVLLRWLAIEDPARLSMVCMAAVRLTYADCLTRVPIDQMPPGALALTPPTEGES